jgi:hypothetical protein
MCQPESHSQSLDYQPLSMVLKFGHIYAAAYRIDDRLSVATGHVANSFALANGYMFIGRPIWSSFSHVKLNISRSCTQFRKSAIIKMMSGGNNIITGSVIKVGNLNIADCKMYFRYNRILICNQLIKK